MSDISGLKTQNLDYYRMRKTFFHFRVQTNIQMDSNKTLKAHLRLGLIRRMIITHKHKYSLNM